MSLNYIYDSDLLDCKVQIIAHQCFCTGSRKLAKGLAKDIFKRFPYANTYQHRVIDSTPGTIELRGSSKRKERYVCNIYAQYHPGKPSEKDKDTSKNREKWFKLALEKLSKLKGMKEVAFPYKIGCGLAKGEWKKYESFISSFASKNPNIKVFVISKDPKPYDLNLDFIHYLGSYLEGKGILGIDYEDLEKLKEEYKISPPSEDKGCDVIFHEAEDTPTWSSTTLLEYTSSNIPEGWEEFFNAQLDVDYGSLYGLSKYLKMESIKSEILPPLELVYNAFNFIKPKEIKVVICGQDPYHDIGQAMGLSFSVRKGVPPPASLKNIYKELEDEGFKITDKSSGDLTPWCKKGVLMINTALTVRAHEAKSHAKKWNEFFAPALMRFLNDKCRKLVLILWGGVSQELEKYFDESHKKVKCPHPSPLSAHRGFFGSDCFKKANKSLKSLGKEEIDWSL